jgi:hypothetical protein
VSYDDYDHHSHHRHDQDRYYHHRERDRQWRHIRERRERDRELRDLRDPKDPGAESGGPVQSGVRIFLLVPVLWLVLAILSQPAIASYDGWWAFIAVVGLVVFVVLLKELITALLRNSPALGVGCVAGSVVAVVLQLAGVMGDVAAVLGTPPI